MSTATTTYGVYLNGEWVESEPAVAVTNPANGTVVGYVSTVGRDRVHQALCDARRAFANWKSLTAMARADYLQTIAAAIAKKHDDIARTITLENGKPLAQSQAEVAMAVDHFRWFAEEGRRAYGRIVPGQAQGKRHFVLKSPIGVVGAVSPWNFPLVLAARKVAPALAAGCCVILKPSHLTPLSSIALAECIHEVELPRGVFQLVVGDAAELVGEMLANPTCAKISFTGSTEVGRVLIRGAAENITKLSLELGGHAPFVILDDADIGRAVEGALTAKFRNTGQACIAANRVYVQSSVYDEFVNRFVTAVRHLKIGNGLDDGVDVGPMIHRKALERAMGHIADAVNRGARLLCGGRHTGEVGEFLQPTVLADVPDGALCMCEETFGPVAPVCRFRSIDEVIERANRTPYGLAAYVYTNSITTAFRLVESLDFGTIGLNDSVPSTSQCPFGGFGQSGWGRELGMEGLDAFLETKHVSMAGCA
ncbi:MAG: NAD-dependent succinate-semialdehyde dehydrogenase [Pirellulales bacterium]